MANNEWDLEEAPVDTPAVPAVTPAVPTQPVVAKTPINEWDLPEEGSVVEQPVAPAGVPTVNAVPADAELSSPDELGLPDTVPNPDDHLSNLAPDEAAKQKEIVLRRGDIQGAVEASPDQVVGPDVYDAIEARHTVAKSWDDYWGGDVNGDAAINSLENLPDSMFGPKGPFKFSKKQLLEDHAARDKAKTDLFNAIGRGDDNPSLSEKIINWGDYPVRKQYKEEPNIDYNPDLPTSETNYPTITKTYTVPPPDQNRFIAIGAELVKNMAGAADMLRGIAKTGASVATGGLIAPEWHLTKQGPIQKAMFPSENPMRASDKFIADMASFVIADKAVTSTLKAGGKVADRVAEGAMAQRMSKLYNGETLVNAKKVYGDALAAGLDKSMARSMTENYLKKATIGAAMGLAEGSVSDKDSAGIVTPEFLQANFHMDARKAHDLSLMLDTPVLAGTLGVLGMAYKGTRTLGENSLGGLRAFNEPWMKKASQKEAAMKMAAMIDPHIATDSPDIINFKIKAMGDALLNNSTQQLQLGKSQLELQRDTATTVMKGAHDYYRTAYAEMANKMDKKEYNDWISEQATNAASRVVALKTAMMNNSAVRGKMAVESKAIEDTFTDAANKETAAGSLEKAQVQASDVLAKDRTKVETSAAQNVDTLTKEAATAEDQAKNAFHLDPEVSKMINDAETTFAGGSATPIDEKVNGMLGKSYNAFKKMYGDTQTAYQDVAKKHNLQTDETGFLQKLKEVGFEDNSLADDIHADAVDQVPVTADDKLAAERDAFLKSKAGTPVEEPKIAMPQGKFKDPIFKEIGNDVLHDPSYSNLVTNVHYKIQKEIARLSKIPGERATETVTGLRQLDDHIFNDQPGLIGAKAPALLEDLDAAKAKYINYKSAWEDIRPLKEVSKANKARFNANDRPEFIEGSKAMPAGVTPEGQGVRESKRLAREIYEANRKEGSRQYNEALEDASAAGGQPIKKDMQQIAEMRLARAMSDKAKSGVQNVAGLRATLDEGVIEELERTGSPMVKRIRELEKRIPKVEEMAKLKGAARDDAEKAFSELKTTIDNSVAAKFTHGVDGIPNEYKGIGDPTQVMDKIFKDEASSNHIDNMLRKADSLGKDGEVIKDAIRGSYYDFLRRQVFGNAKIGVSKLSEEGVPQLAKEVSERGFVKVTEDKAMRRNIETLYGKEALKDLDNVVQALNDTTLRFDRGKIVSSALPPKSDPRKGMTSAITFILGVLNPKATTAKRLANPVAEIRAQELHATGDILMAAALNDPKLLHQWFQDVPDALLQQRRDEARYWIIRAGLQADQSGTYAGAVNPFDKEKDRDYIPPQSTKGKTSGIKIPEGVRGKEAGPTGPFKDQIRQGNIDLTKRPKVKLADGSTATVRSMSFEEDGNEVLVPTISQDGKELTNKQAIELYRKTGQHLGKFKTPEAADAYAEALHQSQENYYLSDK